MSRRWFFACFSLSSAFFAACLVSACQSSAPQRQAQNASAIEEGPAPTPIDLSNATWQQIAAPYAMAEHTATALDDGRVLVLGGIVDAGQWQATTDMAYAFSPGSNTWTPLPSMFSSRASHSATKLHDGRVLVFGGNVQDEDLYTFIAASEIFNPFTSTWAKVNPTPAIGRAGHAAVLLHDGTVLAIGGNYDDGVAKHVDLYYPYDSATGSWYDAAWLEQARVGHTATVMPTGTVLVAGGHDSFYDSTSTTFVLPDVYGAWSEGYAIAQPRAYHTATLLQDGRVLVAGGRIGSSGFLNSAELVEEPQGAAMDFSITPLAQQSPSPMNLERAYHTAALLPDGRVLVVGGRGLNGTHDSTEIYDPETYSWSLGPSLTTPRSHHAMVVLPGRVIVVGGFDDQGTALASVEVLEYGKELGEACSADFECLSGHCADGVCCDTACDSGCAACTAALKGSGEDGVCDVVADGTNPRDMCFEGMTCLSGQCSFPTPCPECDDLGGATWQLVTAPYPMFQHTVTPLDDGRVLVAGGRPGTDPQAPWMPTDRAFAFTPGSNTWTELASMNEPRSLHSATNLNDGRVLVTGGFATDTSELFDPTTSAWTSVGTNPEIRGRTYHADVAIPDGRVFILGGADEGFTDVVEVYDPTDGTTGSWSWDISLDEPRAHHTATLLPNGTILVVGGATHDEFATESTLVREPPYDSGWLWGPWLVRARRNHTATLLPDGRVLLVGGKSAEGVISATEIVDVTSGGVGTDFTTLTTEGPAPARIGRAFHTAGLLPDGRIIVVGGEDDVEPTAFTEIYDPQTNTWKYGPKLNVARSHHRMLVLGTRVIVFGGVDSYGNALPTVEILDLGEDLGASCANDLDCKSGSCVDGVCCDTACEGACVACTAALKGSGEDGVCEPVAEGTNPRLLCEDQGAATCGSTGVCGADGNCAMYPDGTECGDGKTCQAAECLAAPSCENEADGTECGPGKICQGGVCVDEPPCWDQPDGTACGDGMICEAGECVAAPSSACADQADGTLCDEGDGCTVGICRDGACVEAHRVDGTRCEGGVCIAGQCRLDPTATPPSEEEVDGGSNGGNVDGEGSAGNGRDDAADEDGDGGGCSLAPSAARSSSVATSFALLAAMGLIRRRKAARP